jgi:conjugal transfer mating pair stabilization protein TraG
MEFQIYAYGHGEIVKSVFDALAMCLNGQDGSLYEALKRLGLILGAFWAAIYAIYGDQMKLFTGWIIPFTAIIGLLFVPQTTVWITDPVTRYHQKVDHVPYGLGAFAGYVSKIGHGITEQVEKVFVLPDDLKYQRSGNLFASNLLQKAKTFHITNQDLADNMRHFVEQCVVYDAMIGRKYTIEDLRNSDDLWGLVSANVSPVRSFVWRNIKSANDGEFKAGSEIITCQRGVGRFNRLWNQELNRAATIFGKRIFGNDGAINARRELLKYLPLSYNTLGQIAKSATDIMRQQMMIFSIVDSIDQGATAAGHTPNFAARRAYLQQRSAYETLGAMAGETLPTMKAVLESIAYGAFIFVIPLALLPFGFRFLLAWGQVLLWLQMWAPLYAILNYIMTIAARSKTLSVLSMSNDAGVTLATSVGVANVNADIAAMAGYLAMSIPFLSIAIVKGVGSFVHMASHLGNVSQSSASMAAGEATSGNLSFGNISEGNVQIQQSHMFNQSRAASYKAGSFQLMDGRTDVQTYGDGSQVVNVGTSNLHVSLNVAESLSTQQSEMAAQAQQRGFALSESSSQSLASSYRNMADLSKTLGQSEHMSDGVTQGVSAEQSKAIQKSADLIESFARDNNISTEKAASLFAEVSAGGGVFLKGSAGGKTNISASDKEIFDKATKFSKTHGFQEAAKEAAQAAQSISHTVSDESTKRLSEGVAGSYERGMSQRAEASKSFSESESYTRQAMTTRANSASINANYNQQFVEWLANQPADNAPGRLGTQSAVHIIANDPQMAAVYASRFMETKGLMPSGAQPSPSFRQDYERDIRHNSYTPSKEPIDSVRQQVNIDDTIKARGADFRGGAQQEIDLMGHRVDVGKSEVRQEGQKVQSAFKQQKGRWVSERVAEALQKEVIGNDKTSSATQGPRESQRESQQTHYERYDPTIDTVRSRQFHAQQETRQRGAENKLQQETSDLAGEDKETNGPIHGEVQQK